ncbi:acetate--CoA ligase family protein [Thermodesulfobacteriota bacterium]
MKIIRDVLSEGRTILSEHESKALLREYYIPVTNEIEVFNIDSFKKAVKEIGFPLVIKGCGSKLSHKTERNLVRVDIRSEEESVEIFDEIMLEVKDDGGAVLVQEMVKGRRELLAGLTRDPQFGPCVMFGLGGILTEVLKDISFRVAPLEKKDALEMMQEINARKILEGIRGLPPADLDGIAGLPTFRQSLRTLTPHIEQDFQY